MSYRPYQMATALQGETDEAFARRLYAQESGLQRDSPSSRRSPFNRSQSTQNVSHSPNQAQIHGQSQPPTANLNVQNPTVINARYNEVTNSRGNLLAVLIINIPQIVVAVIILSMYWESDHSCDDAQTTKWKLWAVMSTIRMSVYSLIIVIMYYGKDYFEHNQRQLIQITSLRNIVDAMGLVWFIIGNLWLFGDDQNCDDTQKSPIYGLCFAMVLINYLQICLPCILAVLLLPLFCFCMPCLIRILARYNRTNQGASTADISTLPVVPFTPELLHELGDDSTCPICLSEINIADESRVFRCKHVFHKDCVDPWLHENATCPTCRKSVFPDRDEINNYNNNDNNSTSRVRSASVHGPGLSNATVLAPAVHVSTAAPPHQLTPMPQEDSDNELSPLTRRISPNQR